MRPSFRLSTAVGSPPLRHSANDETESCSDDYRAAEADVVCELSPLRPSLPLPSSFSASRVEERLLDYGRIYEERRKAALAARRVQEEETEAQGALQSLSAPSQRHAFVPTPSLYAIAEVSRSHRAERQSAYRAERAAAEQPAQPAILPVSRDMAAALRQREQLSGLPVGEVLHARKQAYEARMEARRREEAAKLSFRPAVSAYTKQLAVRPGSVVQRLYAARATTGAVLADVTNRPRAPSRAGSAASTPWASATAATYQRLYHDAVTRQAQGDVQEKLRLVCSTDAFKPTIDPVSSLIALQSSDTAQGRLFRPKAGPDHTRHVNLEETFAPRINTTAKGAAASNTFFARGEVWQRRRDDRLRRAAEERRDAETKACTFRPRTNRGPASHSPWEGGKGAGGAAASSSSLPSSTAYLVESAEALLSDLHLDPYSSASCHAPWEGNNDEEEREELSQPSQHWADVLRSSVPADILDILREAGSASRDSCQTFSCC